MPKDDDVECAPGKNARGNYKGWQYTNGKIPRSTRYSRRKQQTSNNGVSKCQTQTKKIRLLKQNLKQHQPTTDDLLAAASLSSQSSESTSQLCRDLILTTDSETDSDDEQSCPKRLSTATMNLVASDSSGDLQQVCSTDAIIDDQERHHSETSRLPVVYGEDCSPHEQQDAWWEEEASDEGDIAEDISSSTRLDVDNEEDAMAVLLDEDTTESSPEEEVLDEAACPDNDSDDSEPESEDEAEAAAPKLNLRVKEKIKLLLLLATKKRHILSYSAAESIMELAGVLSGDDQFLPSRHTMKNAINEYSFGLTEHHICPECGGYFGQAENETFLCDTCDKHFDTKKNRKDGNYFIYHSLHDQLKTLMETCLTGEDFIKPDQRNKANQYNYEDIFDGARYKKEIPSEYLSFNFFVDGLQVATTCKKSAWPVLLCLNELPLHLRRKYVLMACLWMGKGKPKCNEYLKPFVHECHELYVNGVTYKSHDGVLKTQKFKPLTGVTDSVARPMVRNSSQFNGKYGCGLCLHPGYRMRFGRGYVRSYSLRNGTFPPRTHQETMDHARIAETRRTPYKGIKGVSVLSILPGFDIVRGLDLDSFHCLVNVAKRFYRVWFHASFKNNPFSISHRLAEVDKRLLSITPTCDVSRFPRSLVDSSDYRGHEWYYWIFMYSIPCLKNILPPRFLNHWGLLVHAISLLMQNSVAKSDVAYADRFLHQFVTDIDCLYGPEHVTFSIHLLTHLKESVVDYSQPWTHSAFIYESVNAEIKNCVKSSNGAAQQISKGMQLKVALKKLEDDVKNQMTEREKKYFLSMTTATKHIASPHRQIGPAALLGKPETSCFAFDSLRALRRAGVAVDETVSYPHYLRCQVFDVIFHGTQYLKAVRQNNSVALLDNNNVFIISSFVVVADQCYALGHCIADNPRQKLCDRELPHFRVLKKTDDGILRCIPIQQIQSKLLSFSFKVSDKEYLRLACVNVLEMEMLT